MKITENRLKHSHAVAVKMKEFATEKTVLFPVSPYEAFILGMLHDIGYEFVNEQQEHANAGGNILKEQGYKYWQEIYYHGIPQTDYDSVMLRLLNYVDMITGPNGTYMSIDDRIKDIAERYGDDSWQVKEAIELAAQMKEQLPDMFP